MAALRQIMAINYRNVFKTKVFNNPEIAGKDRVKFQRLLSSEEANTVLEIVWKESDFVTLSDLSRVGFKRKLFAAGISVYALGVSISEDKNEVAATVTRIRNIITASRAYGLAYREKVHVTSSLIRCTSLLHEIMIELGDLNRNANDRFQPDTKRHLL